MVVSRIGFLKSMKVVPEVSVKLLWNLGKAWNRLHVLLRISDIVTPLRGTIGTSLSRRYMHQTAQLKRTAHLLQTTLATDAGEDGGNDSTKQTLSKVAMDLETTTSKLETTGVPLTPLDPAAKWRKVQAAGFEAIRRVNSAPTGATEDC